MTQNLEAPVIQLSSAYQRLQNHSEKGRNEVLWLNETKIELLNVDLTHHVWRKRNAEVDQKSNHHRGESIMLWG